MCIEVKKMKVEVKIPENVGIEIIGNTIKVSGTKGTLERTFQYPSVKFKRENTTLHIFAEKKKRRFKAILHTYRAHINNMIKGVTTGFTYHLKVVQTHFPITVKTDATHFFVENFFGENVPRKLKLIPGVKVEIDGKDIYIKGIDKEKCGLFAGQLEKLTQWVHKKDRRKFQDGIYIYKKPK
jgi:large subunit ribosomal protein L6